MIILDEDIPESQRQLLRGWRISCRQIGHEVGRAGMKDDEVIPLLMGLTRPTFVTLDHGFYERTLCHSRFCLVFLEVREYEAALFTRKQTQTGSVVSEQRTLWTFL